MQVDEKKKKKSRFFYLQNPLGLYSSLGKYSEISATYKIRPLARNFVFVCYPFVHLEKSE